MNFNNEVKLVKVAQAHSNIKFVLQIAADDSKAVYHLV